LHLTKLTHKGQAFEWNEACEFSFQELKKKLTSALVLILLDPTKNFEVYCEACGQGLGCVLMQERKVAAYASRQGFGISCNGVCVKNMETLLVWSQV